MTSKELIKEIDPEYMECVICNRLIHTSHLVLHQNQSLGSDGNSYHTCLNQFTCIQYARDNKSKQIDEQ